MCVSNWQTSSVELCYVSLYYYNHSYVYLSCPRMQWAPGTGYCGVVLASERNCHWLKKNSVVILNPVPVQQPDILSRAKTVQILFIHLRTHSEQKLLHKQSDLWICSFDNDPYKHCDTIILCYSKHWEDSFLEQKNSFQADVSGVQWALLNWNSHMHARFMGNRWFRGIYVISQVQYVSSRWAVSLIQCLVLKWTHPCSV